MSDTDGINMDTLDGIPTPTPSQEAILMKENGSSTAANSKPVQQNVDEERTLYLWKLVR